MTDTQYSPEAIALADAILKASGSNLKNYTLHKTRSEILGAAQEACDIRAELITALKDLWLDSPFPTWTFYPQGETPDSNSAAMRESYITARSNAEKLLRKLGAK